jgi:transposase
MGSSVRYSEAFKLTVIEGISTGKYKSLEEARRMLGIGGSVMIQKWLVKYGREDLLSKRIRIETVSERDEKKELAKRIKDLEAALADAHIDCSLDRAFLQIACERLGMDIETFKKKHALTLSDVRKMRGLK